MAKASLPASLLKRLGEAADGYRNGTDVWIAASTIFPHDAEAFNSEKEAKSFCKSKENYEVFGPYNTPASNRSSKIKITSITLHFEENGEKKDQTIDTNSIDALFLSESSVDKFAIPYYTSLYGVEEAARIRGEAIKSGDLVVLGHTDGTRWLPGRG